MGKLIFQTLSLTVLAFVMSCCTESAVAKGDSIVGHWEWCDAYDATYQPVKIEHPEVMFLEADGSWKYYKDSQLVEEGTYEDAAIEHYITDAGDDLGRILYIDFTSTSGTSRREYYEYRASEDRIAFTGTPGYIGLPYKMWRRIK